MSNIYLVINCHVFYLIKNVLHDFLTGNTGDVEISLALVISRIIILLAMACFLSECKQM